MKASPRLILAAGILGMAATTQAQLPVGSHYPVGAEGIKGASLPPPGVYLRDYNFFYTANRVPGTPADISVTAYVQAPRVIWMTEQTFLGANYGMDVIVPFAYKSVTTPLGDANQFNLADIQIEPLLFSWHLKQFDVAAGYAVWVPSGEFDTSTLPKYLASPGSGYWTHMLTLGGVWYPDEKKTWALSLLSRYEINTEQDKTDVTPGNMGTLEWGLSKNIGHGTDVGLIGYYQQQITQDSGTHAANNTSDVVGVGPEISTFCSKLGLFASLRYAYEVEARNRPQGSTFTLTLTKRF